MQKNTITVLVLILAFLTDSACALSGHVVDQDGNGVANCLVTATASDESYTAYSGSNGAFNLATVPQGSAFTITAIRNGFGQTSSSGTASAAPVILTLQSEPVVLRGKVLTSDGSPIPFALVDGGTLGTRVSDAQGQFSFAADFGQDYVIKTQAMNYYFGAAVVGTLEGDTERTIVGVLD